MENNIPSALLNNKERYYQELFNTVNQGLNCKYTETTDKSGKLSDETKVKISNSHKGKIMSVETKLKNRNAYFSMSEESRQKMINNRPSFVGQDNPFYGKTHTLEAKAKISKSKLGQGKGKKRPDHSEYMKKHAIKKMVINTETGEVFNSLTECANFYSLPLSTLNRWLLVQEKNKMKELKYLDNSPKW